MPQVQGIFVEAAQKGLGFYTNEEEADEIGLEIAARAGLSKEQGALLWLEFMDSTIKQGYKPSSKETTFDECKAWRRQGWKVDGKAIGALLRIDSLNNDHHGLCYRLYNTEREWEAHNMDRFRPTKGLYPFDEASWKILTQDLMEAKCPIPDNRVDRQRSSGQNLT
ncbi:MAG: hypothetical protein M3Q07_12465 [Pseudobdellovibrionaceae bacterium]|nr:hypothetical protein [Pseudobdellovibrionaceae bacterium]